MNKSNRFRSKATNSSPVTDVPGIGAVYGSRLRSQGIHTVGDLRRFQESSDRGDFQATMKSMIGARCDYAGNTYDALNNSSSRSCYSPVASTPVRNTDFDFGSASPFSSTSTAFGSLDRTPRNQINVVRPTVASQPVVVTRPFGFESANNQDTANAAPIAVVQENTTSLFSEHVTKSEEVVSSDIEATPPLTVSASNQKTTDVTASSVAAEKSTSKQQSTTKVTSSQDKTNGLVLPAKPINVTLATSNDAMTFGLCASSSKLPTPALTVPPSNQHAITVAASSVAEETFSPNQQSITTVASNQITTKDPTRSAIIPASNKDSVHVAISEGIFLSSVSKETSTSNKQPTTSVTSSQDKNDWVLPVGLINVTLPTSNNSNNETTFGVIPTPSESESNLTIPVLTSPASNQDTISVAAPSVAERTSATNQQLTTTLASSQSTTETKTVQSMATKLPESNKDSGLVERSKKVFSPPSWDSYNSSLVVSACNQKTTNVAASSIAEEMSSSNQQSTTKVTSTRDTTNDFVLPAKPINVTLPTSTNNTTCGVFTTPSVSESKLTTALIAPTSKENTTVVATSSVADGTYSSNQQPTIALASSQSTTIEPTRPVELQTAILPTSNNDAALEVFSQPSVPAAKALSFTFRISDINQQQLQSTVASTKTTTKHSSLPKMDPRTHSSPSGQPASNNHSTLSVPRFNFALTKPKLFSFASVSPTKSSQSTIEESKLFTNASIAPASNQNTASAAISSATEITSSFNQQSTLSSVGQKAHKNTPIKSTAIIIDKEQFAEMKLILNMMTDEILVLNLLKANQNVSPAIEKSATILKFLAKQIMSKETQTMLEDISRALSDTNKLHIVRDVNGTTNNVSTHNDNVATSTAKKEIKEENGCFKKL